jgi:hypothetical protein
VPAPTEGGAHTHQSARHNRLAAFWRRYEDDTGLVLSNIARVGAAVRTGNPAAIEAARREHEDLMQAIA